MKIQYKNHEINLDGIVATIHYKNELIFKTRAYNYVEVLKSLKSFINLRLEQIEKDKRINIYV